MSEIRYADGRYSGKSGPIFGLSLTVAILTLFTFGIYRFWGKTRIRRYIWSSAELDGDRFEYTGTGLEKFLGFLMAVVFLAIYLGIVQMLLTFVGLNLLTEPETEAEMVAQALAFNLTFLSLVPFLLFAVYRARRYKLARTRWRGIRFGMDKGAWGYAFRAIGHYLLTILTLGILLPRQTFHLEKYMTDRMWFGDTQFEQGGRWQDLYGAMKHVFIGLAVIFLGIAVGIAFQMELLLVVLPVVGYFWLMIGFIHYRVQSFAYLTTTKALGGQIAFDARPQTSTVIMTYIIGGIVISVVVGIVTALLGTLAVVSLGDMSGGAPSFGVMALLGIGYVGIILGVGAASTALIVQPIIAHYVDTFTAINIDAANVIRQRVADKGADAEGFADALDIGGAI